MIKDKPKQCQMRPQRKTTSLAGILGQSLGEDVRCQVSMLVQLNCFIVWPAVRLREFPEIASRVGQSRAGARAPWPLLCFFFCNTHQRMVTRLFCVLVCLGKKWNGPSSPLGLCSGKKSPLWRGKGAFVLCLFSEVSCKIPFNLRCSDLGWAWP